MRYTANLRTALTLAVLGAALLALPAVAQAAKVRISGGSVRVSDQGVAAIGLKNPNGSKAKGTLKLNWNGQSGGSKRFKIPARRSRTVSVPLAVGVFRALEQNGSLLVDAAAKAKGKGTSRKSITLTYAGAPAGGAPPATTPPTSTPPTTSGPWQEGRWQGTWATNSTDLAFNIVGNRLYTGPFDAFYIESICTDPDPGFGSAESTDAWAIEPVEATIAADGTFSGSGTFRPSSTRSVPWTLTGRVSGGSLTGTFSANYNNGYGHPCSGSANFTAGWYGDYTL